MSNKTVLGFCIGGGKEKLIRQCCRSACAEYRSMVPSDSKKSLGSLAGIAGISPKAVVAADGEKIQSEMLVFSGFDQEALEEFLDLYRTMGIEKIDYKAMVTMHNIFWTPQGLYQELKKEHASMKR